MIFPPDLPPHLREEAAAALLDRIDRSDHQEWRTFWACELVALRGDVAAALSGLKPLSTSPDAQVAIAALGAIGGCHQMAGANDLACRAYEEALAIDPGISLTLHVRVHLASLLRNEGRPADAIEVLQPIMAGIYGIAVDTVQFVVGEYAQALIALGRMDEAQRMLNEIAQHFPDRTELALMKSALCTG